jgi:AcrR family transcriptional regulator
MDLLLQAALRLFVSQGYRSSNLEQISGAAQLTKGAVYFYFGSKEAVLLELLRRVQDVGVAPPTSWWPTCITRRVWASRTATRCCC